MEVKREVVHSFDHHQRTDRRADSLRAYELMDVRAGTGFRAWELVGCALGLFTGCHTGGWVGKRTGLADGLVGGWAGGRADGRASGLAEGRAGCRARASGHSCEGGRAGDELFTCYRSNNNVHLGQFETT